MGIHCTIQEKSVDAAMHVVRTRFAHNVDGSACGRSQVGGIVAAVDLEFLHCVLADGRAHAAGIIAGLTAVHGNVVPSSIASVERKAALRCLFHAKILVTCQPRGIGNTGSEQSECEVVAPVDGEVGDVLLAYSVSLASSFGFYHGRFARHLDY